MKRSGQRVVRTLLHAQMVLPIEEPLLCSACRGTPGDEWLDLTMLGQYEQGHVVDLLHLFVPAFALPDLLFKSVHEPNQVSHRLVVLMGWSRSSSPVQSHTLPSLPRYEACDFSEEELWQFWCSCWLGSSNHQDATR